MRELIEKTQFNNTGVYFIEECIKNNKRIGILKDTYFYKLSYKTMNEEHINEVFKQTLNN